MSDIKIRRSHTLTHDKARHAAEKMARRLQKEFEGVGFFLITSGDVAIIKDGRELARLGEGDFFGEMALLDNFRRSATAKALAPTETLALLRSDFIAELRGNADLAVEMLSLMSRRVREADTRLSHE